MTVIGWVKGLTAIVDDSCENIRAKLLALLDLSRVRPGAVVACLYVACTSFASLMIFICIAALVNLLSSIHKAD